MNKLTDSAIIESVGTKTVTQCARLIVPTKVHMMKSKRIEEKQSKEEWWKNMNKKNRILRKLNEHRWLCT